MLWQSQARSICGIKARAGLCPNPLEEASRRQKALRSRVHCSALGLLLRTAGFGVFRNPNLPGNVEPAFDGMDIAFRL